MAEKIEHDFESLREEISSRYDSLSKRLREIAKYSLDHPTVMAIETIAVISKRAEVQPSVLIRFAKTFGFSGFSDMQKSFQSRVLERTANYKERVRVVEENELVDSKNINQSVLQQYCKTNITSLQELQKSVSADTLEAAADLLESADNIYLIAQRRSFPVATYLNYTLNHANYRTHLLTNTGGMLFEVADNMRKSDVLIAISFPPYSHETAKVVSIASKKNMPVIVISDSSLSPITSAATVYFQVQDAEVYAFRSLSSSMCIAQTLATLMAFRNKT